MSDSISNALGLPTLVSNTVERLPVVTPASDDSNADYEFARGNMISTIDKGREALDGILEVAQISQNPRSYEVVAKLIDSMTNASEKLLDLQKKQKDISGETSAAATKTVNNNLFVGSTAELQAFLKNQNESQG